MSNVVNLNKFRKRRAKEEEKKRAETNVRLHGRTRAERALEAKQKELLERRIEGARLSEPTSGVTTSSAESARGEEEKE